MLSLNYKLYFLKKLANTRIVAISEMLLKVQLFKLKNVILHFLV